MKAFSIFLFLISMSTFAQIGDGYHVEDSRECQSGQCLLVDGLDPIEMIKRVDVEGHTYEEINTDSSILDVLIPNSTSKACFSSANSLNLIKVINALIGNTNRDYTQGGHSYIADTQLSAAELGLVIKLRVISDYDEQPSILSFEVGVCR